MTTAKEQMCRCGGPEFRHPNEPGPETCYLCVVLHNLDRAEAQIEDLRADLARVTEELEEVVAQAEDDELQEVERADMKPRDPGCECTIEEGDSPCPVHGNCPVCEDGLLADLVAEDGASLLGEHCASCGARWLLTVPRALANGKDGEG